MCLIKWYLRINILIVRFLYTQMKRRKRERVLSKKVNFSEYEDIVYYTGMVLTGKNTL